MALPVGVFSALGELAMSPKVQDFASGLVKNVYGRIMPSKADDVHELNSSALTIEDLATKIGELPRRDELVASFAFLQAELDRQNQITRRYVVAGAAVLIVVMVGLTAWIAN